MTKLMSVAVLLILGLGSVGYAEPQSVVAPLVPVLLAGMEQGQLAKGATRAQKRVGCQECQGGKRASRCVCDKAGNFVGCCSKPKSQEWDECLEKAIQQQFCQR